MTESEKTPFSGTSFRMGELAIFAFAAVSSWFLSKYLNIATELLVWLIFATLEFFAVRFLFKVPLRGKVANISVGLFSALFTFSLILGEHIVVGDPYNGLSDTNYISSYGFMDICAFVAILPGVYALLAAPIARIRQSSGVVGETAASNPQIKPLGVRWVLSLTLLVFVLWVPYLVIYWPGFVFDDTLFSLGQALGRFAWNNHHPAAYTAFLAVCLSITDVLGLGHTVGIGLSTIAQMAFMAFGFGYFSRWIVVRGSLKPLFGIALAAAFGLCSYIGSFSVALWKDPIFCSAGLLLSICLADLAWSRGKAVFRKGWLVLFIVSALVMMFLRNNGVFVMALVCVVLLAVALVAWARSRAARASEANATESRTSKANAPESRTAEARASKAPSGCAPSYEPRGWLSALGISLAALAVYVVVSGPGYAALGIAPSEASEGSGVPLNQMARVAALDGEMTESDREYLGTIIPFEEYATNYYPCCTDRLKWSSDFNNEALQNGLWSHWASMLVRNPNMYFQAWELQTFGFWAVNTEKQIGWSWNVSPGYPRNTTESDVQQLEDNFLIYPTPLALDSTAKSIFPIDSWSVPISWLFWVACYLVILLCLGKKPLWALGLIPSIGVAATLLIATPICYWPRYGAILQFCIPYFMLLVYLMLKGKMGPKQAAS